MIANSQSQKMTVEQYLDWEPLQNCRYEYVNGEVFAMTGRTIPHNDIALNVYRALYPHVRSKGCRINVADVKVQVSASSPYYYPDVILSCDSRDLNARKFIEYPTLIIEVLSPSTEAKDRGEKFAFYRSITTLQEYLLIESETVGVECYRRGEGRMWLYYPYTTGDTIAIESLEFSCAVDLLYEGITFN
jgi:Uma2 family endonuclease